MTTAGTIYDSLQGTQNGVLRYVDATHLSYLPYGGDQLKINGIWRVIPTTGIVGLTNTGVFVNGVAGQNLAASTVYYVYAFMNGTVMTADYSTTTHATSLTAGNVGTEIKSGDNTRTLLGMIYHRSNSTFFDDISNRAVRSWLNRNVQRRDLAATYTAILNLSALSFVEISAAIRCNFLNWAGETVTAHFVSTGYHATINYLYLGVAWDGNLPSYNLTIDIYPGNYDNLCTSDAKSDLSEGVLHYATMVGSVDQSYVTIGGAGVYSVLSGGIRD